MKKQIDIFNERLCINEKKQYYEKQIKSCENDLTNLQNECSHKLILAFDDHISRRVGRIIRCYCPACGKKEKIITRRWEPSNYFNDSKLVDFTDIPAGYLQGSLPTILGFIFSNYDYYYSDDVSGKQIADSIISRINEEQKDKNKMIIKTLN